MTQPLISIIVPVYKVEKYLDECVQSIVDQTYKNLEIILVDDGSPDKCPAMCDEWAYRDTRIRVIHKENGGASSARNVGLDIATGTFIGFVDSDDYIEPRMYEVLLKALTCSNKKIACCNYVRFKEKKEVNVPRQPYVEYTTKHAVAELLRMGKIGSAVWDKLFTCDLFFDIRFPVGETNEEYPLLLPLIAKSNGIAHSGEVLYCYRVTEGSITNNTWKTDAHIVLKHLQEMRVQMNELSFSQLMPEFELFSARSAYGTALCLDKNYHRISEKAKENMVKYIRIMRKNSIRVLFSRYVHIKDKILYFMVTTRTLRPVYRLLGRL